MHDRVKFYRGTMSEKNLKLARYEPGDLAADCTETSIGGGGLFHAKTDIDTLRLLSPRILVTGTQAYA